MVKIINYSLCQYAIVRLMRQTPTQDPILPGQL